MKDSTRVAWNRASITLWRSASRALPAVVLTLALPVAVRAELGLALTQFFAESTPGVLGVPSTSNWFGHAFASGDFDCDGFPDLAVGTPGADRPGASGTGAVQLFYGGPEGISLRNHQIFQQYNPGMIDESETNDAFGTALAAADFDGQGCDDLAIGVPGESIGDVGWAGAVQVLYGLSGIGLTAIDNQLWHQGSPGISDDPEFLDSFGETLVAGDFDRDGYGDLAIGVPQERLDGLASAGLVTVMYGSSAGFTGDSVTLIQGAAGIPDTSESSDYFGWALATGDFDRDGFDDLVVGVPYESLAAGSGAGQVTVVPGGPTGLTNGGEVWNLDLPGVAGTGQEMAWFGYSLATGDFDGDGYTDLAVGAPRMAVGAAGEKEDAGVVTVLYGGSDGLGSVGSQSLHQDSAGSPDGAEASDEFGTSLAAGDFDGDGFDDLAVGIPYEAVGALVQAGAVQIVSGSASGLTTAGGQFWHQDVPGMPGGAEAGDYFGRSLLAADLDANAGADLQIGVTGEDLADQYDPGAVHVLYSSGAGLVLPRTGASKCFNAVGELMSCPGTGQDGELREGMPWPAARFISRSPGTVDDLLTGLGWLQDMNCLASRYPELDGLGPMDGGVSWQAALDFVAGINAGDYPECGGGFTDWRLPNFNELESLLHFGAPSQTAWLLANGFLNLPSGPEGAVFWSSTSRETLPHTALAVAMDGELNLALLKDGPAVAPFVWPVRDVPGGSVEVPKTGQIHCWDSDGQSSWQIPCAGTGQDGDVKAGALPPVARLQTIHCNAVGPCGDPSSDCDGDPSTDLVLDRFTGLVWPRNLDVPDGEVTWAAAFVFLRWLNGTGGGVCGYSDWRIPNIRELRSLTGFGPQVPIRDPVFVNPPTIGFWSSTWYEPAQSPLGVSRFNGNTFFGRSNPFHLLPVRAGSLIFADGFEAGHTAPWSNAVP